MLHASNLSTWETEAGGMMQAQGSLNYVAKPSSQKTKRKNEKKKITYFCSAKDNVQRMKGQTIQWKKSYKKNTLDKRLI